MTPGSFLVFLEVRERVSLVLWAYCGSRIQTRSTGRGMISCQSMSGTTRRMRVLGRMSLRATPTSLMTSSKGWPCVAESWDNSGRQRHDLSSTELKRIGDIGNITVPVSSIAHSDQSHEIGSLIRTIGS